ncbi:hypothetical protein HJG60_010225 [Phyllostomus discolor]|uniref:Uncharacterized protein n=1 Tax=Phyllostomus discolor TaxID=89673 RepID=A0A834EK55_9CHIR|nr:hypothetical protein HJG60_010225 [Phyllostomus discolor]
MLRPGGGREEEEGLRVEKLKVPGSDMLCWKVPFILHYPALPSCTPPLLAHTSPILLHNPTKHPGPAIQDRMCHPAHSGLLPLPPSTESFPLCQKSRSEEAQPVTGTAMNVLYPGEDLRCNSRNHLNLCEQKGPYSGPHGRCQEVKTSGWRLRSRPQHPVHRGPLTVPSALALCQPSAIISGTCHSCEGGSAQWGCGRDPSSPSKSGQVEPTWLPHEATVSDISSVCSEMGLPPY